MSSSFKKSIDATEGTVLNSNKYVTLTEDTFGMLFDDNGTPELVKRYTWKNHNRIRVQVITYGARITSIKLPDRSGNVEEVVLGFDDLGGYLFYDKYFFGATIGRTTSTIMGATYDVNGKQFWLSQNSGPHHVAGGNRGFDKMNWVPTVNGNQVIMCYLSKDKEEGYPGDLYVRVCYELTASCEFKINITANTTKITPVDITNMTYFNLSGHESGEAELRKHEVIINANCHTPMDKDGRFATGEILNVVHTRNNFQTPKMLNKAMGLGPDCGFDQNFCVNRGVDQEMAFVGRVTHVYKGRILEVYSNKRGVNLYTCNKFPTGQLDIPAEFAEITQSMTSNYLKENEGVFITVKKIEEYLSKGLGIQPAEYQAFMQNLVSKLLKPGADHEVGEEESFNSNLELLQSARNSAHNSGFVDVDLLMLLKPVETQFLKAVRNIIPYVTEDMDFQVVKDIIDDVLAKDADLFSVNQNYTGSLEYINKILDKQMNTHPTPNKVNMEEEHVEEEEQEQKNHTKFSLVKNEKMRSMAGIIKYGNNIPDIYKENRITGRGGTIYKRYAGFSLRTQNYPTALTHYHFPCPLIRPHETYHHDITYKFLILGGNPKKWLKRMEIDASCIAHEQIF